MLGIKLFVFLTCLFSTSTSFLLAYLWADRRTQLINRESQQLRESNARLQDELSFVRKGDDEKALRLQESINAMRDRETTLESKTKENSELRESLIRIQENLKSAQASEAAKAVVLSEKLGDLEKKESEVKVLEGTIKNLEKEIGAAELKKLHLKYNGADKAEESGFYKYLFAAASEEMENLANEKLSREQREAAYRTIKDIWDSAKNAPA